MREAPWRKLNGDDKESICKMRALFSPPLSPLLNPKALTSQNDQAVARDLKKFCAHQKWAGDAVFVINKNHIMANASWDVAVTGDLGSAKALLTRMKPLNVGKSDMAAIDVKGVSANK